MRWQQPTPISGSFRQRLPLFPTLAFPSTLQVVSGHGLWAWRAVSYLVSKPQVLFGKCLVCMCRTQWLCLPWIQCACVHPRMHIHSHMQALFSLRQSEERRAYWSVKAVARSLMWMATYTWDGQPDSFSHLFSSVFMWAAVYSFSFISQCI